MIIGLDTEEDIRKHIVEVLAHIAQSSIYKYAEEHCGQKYCIAEDLGITIKQLEVVCRYLDIDLDTF